MRSWLIRGDRVVLPDGMRPAVIRVDNGVITAIDCSHSRSATAAAGAARSIDAGAAVVMPGIVDTHVHINEPGRTEWEGFETATRAAAAGGVTTLVDMPLNSIPATTNVEALDTKRRAAEGRCHVDVGFWGGVVPGNARRSRAARARGRAWLQVLSEPVWRRRIRGGQRIRPAARRCRSWREPACRCSRTRNGRLCSSSQIRRGSAALHDVADTRPPGAEHAAIDLLLQLSGARGARVHIVHLASAGALPAIKKATTQDVRVTVETCPHYLTFCAEEIAAGATAWKCAPPIRERDHRERLWRALRDGEIRSGGHRSFSGAAGLEASRRWRFHRRVGRHCLAAARLAGDVDRREAARHSVRAAGRMDVRERRRSWPD